MCYAMFSMEFKEKTNSVLFIISHLSLDARRKTAVLKNNLLLAVFPKCNIYLEPFDTRLISVLNSVQLLRALIQ
jgi:hypothetical protein